MMLTIEAKKIRSFSLPYTQKDQEYHASHEIKVSGQNQNGL